MWTVLIPAIALIITSAGTILLTKQKERDAAWRAKKLAYYEDFFGAASGIVGEPPPEAQVRFATATNNLHLIGSADVISALHAFTDEIAASNRARFSIDRHDALWSRLVWEIRADLDSPPTDRPEVFKARLWASGVQTRHQQLGRGSDEPTVDNPRPPLAQSKAASLTSDNRSKASFPGYGADAP